MTLIEKSVDIAGNSMVPPFDIVSPRTDTTFNWYNIEVLREARYSLLMKTGGKTWYSLNLSCLFIRCDKIAQDVKILYLYVIYYITSHSELLPLVMLVYIYRTVGHFLKYIKSVFF